MTQAMRHAGCVSKMTGEKHRMDLNRVLLADRSVQISCKFIYLGNDDVGQVG
jgi:hypothetical protein